MNKSDAIKIFGSAANLSRAIGVTRGRISQLPENLHQRDIDRIAGAALRLGLSDQVKPLIKSGNGTSA